MADEDDSESSTTEGSEPINYMDMQEFREFGYLQEVNRQFLHPLGLAFSVKSPGWTKDAIGPWLAERGVQFGEEACDHIWTFIVKLGLDKEHLGEVWDYRDDPEGIAFGPNMIDADKVKRVSSQKVARRDARVEALGYWVQPSPPAD